ncbi:MAG: hypothetical protein GEU83_07090 [Pseudonocardiaceae bacterium]|nr:hypothetical protein [Pseudonocardiaceae bacterium]
MDGGHLMSAPTASIRDVLESAGSRPGSGDWGDLGFVPALELLLQSCRETAELTPAGCHVLDRIVRRHLRNRLALREHLRHSPMPVTPPLAPIVIVGLPRTGTTVLHNLLAQDREHRTLRLWEALRPGAAAAADDPDRRHLIDQAHSWLQRSYQVAPDLPAVHPLTAEGPEECDTLLQNSFASQHFDDMFNAERYSGWFATADLDGEYRYYATQLAVLAAPDPGTEQWVLKSPSHLGHLDALLEVLPGAVILWCHRDPRQAVASYASLIRSVRSPHTERFDPLLAGAQAVQRCSLAMRRAMATREPATRETAAGGRFIDVSYDRLVRDPLGAVAGIYDRMGWSLRRNTRARMQRWLAGNPQHRFGEHRYGPAEFGLREEQLTEEFAGYLDRFAALVGR